MRGLKIFVLSLMMCAGLQGMDTETREIECFGCKQPYTTDNPEHFERKHSNFLERKCAYCLAQKSECLRFRLCSQEAQPMELRLVQVEQGLQVDGSDLELLVEQQRIEGELQRVRECMKLQYHCLKDGKLTPLSKPKR